MDFQTIVSLILVFAAVVVITYVFATVFFRETAVKAEESARRGAMNYDPVSRFIQPDVLIQVRFAAAFLLGGIALTVMLFLQVSLILALILGTLIPALLGFYAVLLHFRNKAKKRFREFENKILDLVMGLANGLRAGMALPQALEVVSRDIGGPLQEEISIALSEYRLGVELPDALDHVYRRIPAEDLKLLITSIRLSQQTGGSMADVLDHMTETIRQRTIFQERLLTLTSQGRFEAMAISLMPVAAFGILYMLDPALMSPLVTTGIGWCGLGVAALMETIGFLIIRKIMAVEV
ncbi:MAG: type II secretion system F family protein [Lentisphaeria bacterium]|nr:type II secretion system F family protein [Lentisphaeria bacterium]